MDLDRYREPARDPASLADRRAALLDQLGWLADEAEALAPMLAGLPAWALEAAPLPGDRSLKETLARLVRLDRTVYPRWIARLEEEAHPTLAPAEDTHETEANARDLGDLIGAVREARGDFIKRVETLPADVWAREATLGGDAVTLYDLLLRVVRHDADALRILAYRLHEAQLSVRPR